MIDSRLFGYIALAFVLMLLYQAWMQDYGDKAAPPVSQSPSSETETQMQDLPQADFSSIPTPAPKEVDDNTELPQVADAVSPSSRPAVIVVKTDVLRLEVDTEGGSIIKAELLAYPIDLQHPREPVSILDHSDVFFVAQSGLQAKSSPAPDHYAKYQAASQQYDLPEGANELSVPLVWSDNSGIKVTKTLILKRGRYDIEIKYTVDNQSDRVWQGSQYRQLQRSAGNGGRKGFTRTYTGGVIYSSENHYEKIKFEEMAEKPLKRKIKNGWAAMIQHYFLAAWIPDRDEEDIYYSRGVDGFAEQRYVLGLISPIQEVKSGASSEFSSKLYVGPKIQKNLEQLAEGLELTVDYGYLTVIAQPLFWLLQKIHNFVGNWGWAIILLTLLIKAVFYKLAETSYRSMANMRRVQPKMTAIKERYGDDRQRQSQAMMELYKKEKINPLGGCLPMIIQIPVFIALYWVLLESVELRQAPFILWINDLSVKDPYYVLPVIMGISMYFQQKLNPAPADPIQAKVFMMLPFVFTVLFATFPAGLVLYWVVNNLLTIAQQWFITRRVLADK